jgi:hypothetical protein
LYIILIIKEVKNMAYIGLIKFIPDTKTEALVFQTAVGNSLADGWRLVRSTDFSTLSVGTLIGYSYSTTAGAATDDITSITT